ILILDEATSALDPESEVHIHDAMMKFKEGRTVVTIAHKLSTIIDADEILFFEKGRIAERGNFNKLIAQKGRFYEFFEQEFGSFRYFSERLSQEILRIKRYKRPFSLIMIELRDLGKIASKIGEEKINKALLEIAGVIRKNTREVDFSTKYHKDRFLIGLPEIDSEHASLAGKRIENVTKEHTYLKGEEDVRFVPIVGISSMGEDANTITELYRNSEKMLEEKLVKE
ncbi:MAG: diguanylate cyclase, partial [Candidatus Omnitrophica bacterium]|nr:diguanylate cyclase [Candidatus Omnitrophota bacterium]